MSISEYLLLPVVILLNSDYCASFI